MFLVNCFISFLLLVMYYFVKFVIRFCFGVGGGVCGVDGVMVKRGVFWIGGGIVGGVGVGNWD